MNNLQKLDAVLLAMEKYHSNGYMDFMRIVNILLEEHPNEEFFGVLLVILDELENDGYIMFRDGLLENKERVYMITFKGRVFNEMRGYWKEWQEGRKSTWSGRNPNLDKLRTGLITTLFSLIVGVLLFQLNNRGHTRLDKLQDQRLNGLKSSLDSFQKRLADSIATLRADTTLKNR